MKQFSDSFFSQIFPRMLIYDVFFSVCYYHKPVHLDSGIILMQKGAVVKKHMVSS